MDPKTALFHLPVLFSTWGWLCLKGMRSRLIFVQLLVTLWTVACQAPLSMGFSSQEYWSESPCPPLGGLSDPGIKPVSVMSPALAHRFFTTRTSWEACLEGRVSFFTQRHHSLAAAWPKALWVPWHPVHPILLQRLVLHTAKGKPSHLLFPSHQYIPWKKTEAAPPSLHF